MIGTRYNPTQSPAVAKKVANLNTVNRVQNTINSAVRQGSTDAISKAVSEIGELKLRTAFSKARFIYGTMGKGSVITRGLRKWANRAPGQRLAEEQGVPLSLPQTNLLKRSVNIFDPGRRGAEFLRGGYQMMDQYYGQAGTCLHEFRDPVIAEFVHRAMGYKASDFSMSTSGRDAYRKHVGVKPGQAGDEFEGWHWKSPGQNQWGTTATKEISRIIRWGIRNFGGELVFEGRELYYSQVFLVTPPRIGDTDAEARELFTYFSPGESSVKFGRGKLVFQWNGVETVPTKVHFFSCWKWANDAVHTLNNMPKTIGEVGALEGTWSRFLTAPSGLGATTDAQALALAKTLLMMESGYRVSRDRIAAKP